LGLTHPTFKKKHCSSPEPVPKEYRSGRHDTHGAVILLRQQLQVVGVLPFPFGATILEPDLDLKIKLKFVKVHVCGTSKVSDYGTL
jgi:hypothetical protein